MTVLVTGAAGFVGSAIVERLVSAGRPVRAMVRRVEKGRARLADLATRIEIVQGDVTRPESLPPLLDGVTAVIHLVAIALEKSGQRYEQVNHQGTVNLVDAARRAGVRRFLHMSQNGADASLPYRFLRSKGLAEEYVARSDLDWTAFRPSSIFGPRDEFFNAIARMVRLTPVFFPLIGGGTAEFQPVSVRDVAEGVVRSLADDTTIGRALGFGGPEVLTLGEIERRILNTLGTRRILFPAPTALLRAPVFVMEHALPGSPVTGELLDLLGVRNVIADEALTGHFGMSPVPFAGEHLAYLRRNTIDVAVRTVLRGEKE